MRFLGILLFLVGPCLAAPARGASSFELDLSHLPPWREMSHPLRRQALIATYAALTEIGFDFRLSAIKKMGEAAVKEITKQTNTSYDMVVKLRSRADYEFPEGGGYMGLQRMFGDVTEDSVRGRLSYERWVTLRRKIVRQLKTLHTAGFSLGQIDLMRNSESLSMENQFGILPFALINNASRVFYDDGGYDAISRIVTSPQVVPRRSYDVPTTPPVGYLNDLLWDSLESKEDRENYLVQQIIFYTASGFSTEPEKLVSYSPEKLADRHIYWSPVMMLNRFFTLFGANPKTWPRRLKAISSKPMACRMMFAQKQL